MTKKFLAVTLVLVLAAGFAAVAQDDERPLTGTWENEVGIQPDDGGTFFELDSDIEATYQVGGLSYTGIAELEETGLVDVEFGVDTTVGLLGLSSTVNFATQTPGLEYWVNEASLTLGGVSITDTFVLQDTKDGVDQGFGAGMDLEFSGETPGGVSVAVNNYFGMEPVIDDVNWLGYTGDDFYQDTGIVTGTVYGNFSIPDDSGYGIVTEDSRDGISYGTSSLQYVGSKLTLENLSMGCCDFSSETMFSEMNGFEYTLFEFTMESETWPLSLDGDLKFTEQTKSIKLEPSLETDWACFNVYTSMDDLYKDGAQANNNLLGSLEFEGFSITGVKLGHVEFSSYTALGSNNLWTLEKYEFYTGYGTVGYDEVFRIEKLEEYPLDFTLDTFFDISNSDALFDLAYFNGDMSYKIDDEFTVGSGVSVNTGAGAGLDEFRLTFDYSF